MISFQNIPSSRCRASLAALRRRGEVKQNPKVIAARHPSVFVRLALSGVRQLACKCITLPITLIIIQYHFASSRFRFFSLGNISSCHYVSYDTAAPRSPIDLPFSLLKRALAPKPSNHRNRKLANQINFQDLAGRRFIIRRERVSVAQ